MIFICLNINDVIIVLTNVNMLLFVFFLHVFIAATRIALALFGWMASSYSHRADEKQKGLCQHYFYFAEAKRTRSPGCYSYSFLCHCRNWEHKRAIHWHRGLENIWSCREAGSLCWLPGCYLHDSKQAKCCHSSILYVLLLSDASGVRKILFVNWTITILESDVLSWKNVHADQMILMALKDVLPNAFTRSIFFSALMAPNSTANFA